MPPVRRLPPHLEKNSAASTIRAVKLFVVIASLLFGAGYAAHLSLQVWDTGQKGVENAKVLNEGQQIQAAARLFKSDHPTQAVTLKGLTSGGYLAKLPEGWVDSANHTHARRYNVSHEMCERLNEKCGVCKDTSKQDLHPDTVQASFGCLPALHMAFFKYQ